MTRTEHISGFTSRVRSQLCVAIICPNRFNFSSNPQCLARCGASGSLQRQKYVIMFNAHNRQLTRIWCGRKDESVINALACFHDRCRAFQFLSLADRRESTDRLVTPNRIRPTRRLLAGNPSLYSGPAIIINPIGEFQSTNSPGSSIHWVIFYHIPLPGLESNPLVIPYRRTFDIVIEIRHCLLSGMFRREWPPLSLTAGTPATNANDVEWKPGVFRILGISSAVIVFTPMLIWLLWTIVKGWGEWKIHSSGNRPHYVRTWHGWVDVDQVAVRAQKRANSKEKYRKWFIWKTTTNDYTWVFWDPGGVKQREYEYNRDHSVIRHLPTWMRSFEKGYLSTDERIVPNVLSAAEEGKIAVQSFRHSSEILPMGLSLQPHQAWFRSVSSDIKPLTRNTPNVGVTTLMTGALSAPDNDDSRGTVRRRKTTPGQVRVWNANSPETRRATCTQFLAPRKTAYAVEETKHGAENRTSPVHLRSVHITDGASDDDSVRRFSSLPPVCAMRNSRFWSAFKAHVEILPLFSRKAPEFYRATVLEGLRAPETSRDSHASCSTTQSNNREAALEASTEPIGTSSDRNITRKLELYDELVDTKPFKSLGNEYCGTAGRPGSPSFGWMVRGVPRPASGSILTEYEAEGSIEGASSYSCSSRSTSSSCSQYACENRKLDLHKALAPHREDLGSAANIEEPGRMCIRGTRGTFLSDSVFQGSYLPGEISSYAVALPPTGYAKSFRGLKAWPAKDWSLTKNIYVPLNPDSKTLIGESVYSVQGVRATPADSTSSFVSRPPKQRQWPEQSASTTMINTKTLRTGMASRASNFSKSTKEIRRTTECLSSLDKSFLRDLDLRLKRLDYELSPGFRGPLSEVADPRWWYDAAPSSAGVASRASQSIIISSSIDAKYPSPSPVLRRSYTAAPSRAKRPGLADLRRRASAQEMVYGAKFTTGSEPDEGTIDTAAWILRRPPMRAIREDSADNSALLFTDGRGPPKTLSEWQQQPEPLLPLQQALNESASAIFKLQGRRLRVRDKLNDRRNENEKDGQRPDSVLSTDLSSVAPFQTQPASPASIAWKERTTQSQQTSPEISPMTERMRHAKRLFNNLSIPINHEHIALKFSSPPSSPNRTMMQ